MHVVCCICMCVCVVVCVDVYVYVCTSLSSFLPCLVTWVDVWLCCLLLRVCVYVCVVFEKRREREYVCMCRREGALCK